MGRQCPVGRAAAGPPAGGVVTPRRRSPGARGQSTYRPEVGKPVPARAVSEASNPPASSEQNQTPGVPSGPGRRCARWFRETCRRTAAAAHRACRPPSRRERGRPTPVDPVGVRPGVDREVVGEECLDDLENEGIVDEEEVAPPHAHDLEADPFVGSGGYGSDMAGVSQVGPGNDIAGGNLRSLI